MPIDKVFTLTHFITNTPVYNTRPALRLNVETSNVPHRRSDPRLERAHWERRFSTAEPNNTPRSGHSYSSPHFTGQSSIAVSVTDPLSVEPANIPTPWIVLCNMAPPKKVTFVGAGINEPRKSPLTGSITIETRRGLASITETAFSLVTFKSRSIDEVRLPFARTTLPFGVAVDKNGRTGFVGL